VSGEAQTISVIQHISIFIQT